MDVDCQACGWSGDVDDLRVRLRETGSDIGVCPDCLSTNVTFPDENGGEAG